ncbi:hypothetical protein [Granulibacter bethesdensis]|uniref:hypothetical protein n=1 Tax=Granulibacter bethesdensis TaxID=364410 RepID=UPI00046CC155|nr:hypothetical protein [Granulibacter bethesdensis]
MSPDQQSQKLFEIADALDKGSLMLNAAEMVLDALPEHRARNAIAALLSDIAAKLGAQSGATTLCMHRPRTDRGDLLAD